MPRRPLPYPRVDIDAVRDYANQLADQTSVRRVAKQIGLRHTTLEKFLGGAQPYAKTRGPICEWYLRETALPPAEPEPAAPVAGGRDREVAEASPRALAPDDHLDALLADLRGEARTEARMRITTALAQAYKRLGKPAPDWLYSRR